MRPAMADVNPALPSRRDRARATRLRMIHAAQRVFTGHGYAGARMTDIAHLAGRFGLPDGLDSADAVDILLTVAGAATYRSLVIDYGWPHDRFVDWLTTTLSQQLLAPPTEPGTGQRRSHGESCQSMPGLT